LNSAVGKDSPSFPLLKRFNNQYPNTAPLNGFLTKSTTDFGHYARNDNKKTEVSSRTLRLRSG
jgi:hypothetical protein